MTQKGKIIELLKKNGSMTQGMIAEAIYGDKNHTPYIHSALTDLVSDGVVKRTGSRPSFYTLTGIEVVLPEKQPPKGIRDVSGDIITNETLLQAGIDVDKTANYGPETALITRCLKKLPDNTDKDIVAMKIGLIDITNSTHLSQHKSKISMVELSDIIVSIPDVDERIKRGDPEVVNTIAKSNGKINLFSFATKYCCYHNRNLYERDDYSILDTVLKDYLPQYFPDITKGQIQKWQDTFNYQAYNDFITDKLDELGITVPFRKRLFDWFVWYKNRQ